MKKQRIGKFFGLFWRQFLFYAACVITVGTILWWHLATLVPAMSLPELSARADASSLHKLLNNPLYLPHKLTQYLFIRLGHSGVFWMRSASAIWAVIVMIIFFDIVRSWYSRRVAIMASLLFLTSAWFLHFARLSTPFIMFTTSVGLLWVGMKLKSVSSPRIRTVLASIATVLVCLYVPGLAWVIIPMLYWQRKHIWGEVKLLPKWLSPLIFIGVIIGIAPLVYGLGRHPVLILDWLMLPRHITIGHAWSSAWHLPVWLVFRGPQLPVYWLGRAPMFDSFSVVMGVLGVFVLSYSRLLDRTKALIVICILALTLTVLNGWLAMLIALPVLYLIITAGIALFLQQWFTVFPRNPLARTVGIVAVSFVVGLACYYNLRHYFVAWPRNAETRQVFDLKS